MITLIEDLRNFDYCPKGKDKGYKVRDIAEQLVVLLYNVDPEDYSDVSYAPALNKRHSEQIEKKDFHVLTTKGIKSLKTQQENKLSDKNANFIKNAKNAKIAKNEKTVKNEKSIKNDKKAKKEKTIKDSKIKKKSVLKEEKSDKEKKKEGNSVLTKESNVSKSIKVTDNNELDTRESFLEFRTGKESKGKLIDFTGVEFEKLAELDFNTNREKLGKMIEKIDLKKGEDEEEKQEVSFI